MPNKLPSGLRQHAIPYSHECIAIIVAEVTRGVRKTIHDPRSSTHRVGNVFYPKF